MAAGGLLQGVVIDVRDYGKTVDGVAVAGPRQRRRGVRRRPPRARDDPLRTHRPAAGGIPGGEARRPRLHGLRRPRRRERPQPDEARRSRSASATSTSRGSSAASPGSSRGRGEACVWLGNPGAAARVRARDCGWTGLWTGTAATGLRVADVDVDLTRTGVYLEHFTHRSMFERIRVGRSVRVGLTAEWADPGWGGLPASVDNVVQASRFESSLAGVYLDEGTTRTIIRGSTFVGQRWAAIGDYEGVDNAYYGNDYRRNRRRRRGGDAGAHPQGTGRCRMTATSARACEVNTVSDLDGFEPPGRVNGTRSSAPCPGRAPSSSTAGSRAGGGATGTTGRWQSTLRGATGGSSQPSRSTFTPT